MKRIATMAAALALSCIAVAMFAGSLPAQVGSDVYEACAPGRAEIRAADLPSVVDQDRCPVAGRMIVDGGIGAVVPEPGMAVTAEAASPEGDQYLTVSNPRDGRFVLEGVGTEARSQTSRSLTSRSSGSACGDRYYTNRDAKLYRYNKWFVNKRSFPSNVSRIRGIAAMRRAGENVFAVHDPCGLRDRVRGTLRYRGSVARSVDINRNATCNANDYKSVVGFGDLPPRYTAYACVWTWVQDGYNRVAHSDIRLNKDDHRWTARVTGSCRGRFDIESSMTHERGHTFGLGEASESRHRNLTMSSETNGTCQTSERSLGKGDARGLNNKYR